VAFRALTRRIAAAGSGGRSPYPQKDIDCRHLGKATDTTISYPHGHARRTIRLYGCAIHQGCTVVAKVPGLPCCVGCGDRGRTAPRSTDLPGVTLTAVNPPPRAPNRLAPGIAFNASVLRYRGRLLMAYRTGWAGARIHVCELGPGYQPAGRSTTLHDLARHPFANYGQEDPRLFVHRDALHVSYIGVIGNAKGWVTTRQLYARLGDDLTVGAVHAPELVAGQREKNWAFFDHEGALYAVYTVRPHTVVRVVGGKVEEAHRTPNDLPWSGGLLRGGAAPVRVGGEYYHFFHGKVELGSAWPTARYSVGVCAFEAAPPFRVTRMTAVPLLTADPATRPADQYCDCVFPCGAVLENGKWVVGMGVHDRWCAVAEFDAAAVEERLDAGRVP
jgi:predicted GH43/DUF377 family glycosyl hydrolase